MFARMFSCMGGTTKEQKRSAHASQFQRRRNSLRGNFVTKYVTPVEDDYVMDEKNLGQGSYGIVVKAHKLSNNRAFAIKFMSKVGHLARIEREVKLLTDLDHANIVRLFSLYDSATQVAFVFDLCSGGDLLAVVGREPRRFLSEDSAKVFIRQLISAVAHIHSRGICHRDIKMQNVLLENLDSSHPQIKLIDFGFATRYVGVTPMKTRCGTPYTTAPEVFRHHYDERCDVWSVGVVSYFLLCGHRPFTSQDMMGDKKAVRQSLVTNILTGQYHFKHPAFKHVSGEGMAFIQKMLALKYTSRWHAIDAVSCPWLSEKFVRTSKVDFSNMRKDSSLSRAITNIVNKQDSSVLSNTGMVAVAFDHTRYAAPEIRTLFQFFDKENAGFLSKKAFKKALSSVAPDLNPLDIDEIFSAIDIDDDKQLSFTEFLAATMDPREVDMQDLGKAFELLDSDNKGYLTVDDFYRVLAVNPDRSASLQLAVVIKRTQGEESSSGNISSSGVPYFDENEHSGKDKTKLLKKIAQMIRAADFNHDGVLSYSEFVLGVTTVDPASTDDDDDASIGPEEVVKEAERARLEALIGEPDELPSSPSFFQRPFGSERRKTAPMLSSEQSAYIPGTSPLSSKNKRFSLGNIRSPKARPKTMPVVCDMEVLTSLSAEVKADHEKSLVLSPNEGRPSSRTPTNVDLHLDAEEQMPMKGPPLAMLYQGSNTVKVPRDHSEKNEDSNGRPPVKLPPLAESPSNSYVKRKSSL